MIDWGRVRDLRADIGDADFAAVAELFVDEVEAALAGLDPAAPAEALARQLHALKGSALNLGFAALARLCAKGEAQARAGLAGAVPVADIRAVWQASRAAFLAGPVPGGPVG